MSETQPFTEIIEPLLEAAGLSSPAADAPEASPAPQDTPPVAKRPKPSKPADISGLVLVDVPSHDLACGQYVTLPADVAIALEAAGAFDPKASRPE